MKVLAIGATGKFAGLVVPALVSHGIDVRAPGMVDRVRLAELMTEAAGREVIAEDLPAGSTLPPGQPDGLGAMFAEYDRHGFHGGNPLVLRTILQHEPRTVAGYLAELGAARSR